MSLHDDAERTHACGQAMDRCGVEITEKLGIHPAHFFTREIARVKYACRKCQDGVVRPDLGYAIGEVSKLTPHGWREDREKDQAAN